MKNLIVLIFGATVVATFVLLPKQAQSAEATHQITIPETVVEQVSGKLQLKIDLDFQKQLNQRLQFHYQIMLQPLSLDMPTEDIATDDPPAKLATPKSDSVSGMGT